MRSPVPLSAQSRSFLELGSEVRPPTAEQVERMRRGLEPLFATQPQPGPEPAPEPGLLRSAGARTWAARGKLLWTLGVLATTAGASFWLGRASIEPARISSTPASVEPASVEPASSGSLTVRDEEPPTTDATRERLPEVPLVPAKTPPSAQPGRQRLGTSVRRSRPLGLASEIERLTAVEAELRRGRAEAALRRLDGAPIHELVEQSAALRAIAGCSLGRRHAAQEARAVLERWPQSAYQARIRETCAL